MEFSIKSLNSVLTNTKMTDECWIIGVFSTSKKAQLALPNVDKKAATSLEKTLLASGFLGKSGTTLLTQMDAQKCLFVGLGEEAELTEKSWQSAVKSAFKVLIENGQKNVCCALTALLIKDQKNAQLVLRATLLLRESIYRFEEFKSKKDAPLLLSSVQFLINDKKDEKLAEEALFASEKIANGIDFAKNLANLPGNICTPTFLAEKAKKLAKTHKLKIDVLERAEMQKLGMNALLAVAQGSIEAPKLIVLHYQGAAKTKMENTAPIVLVGKGITFDSGGISLKPGAAMDEMKFDMCGAASVLGVMQTACELKLKINLIVIVPTTENMPDGGAIKPGDIVKSMSGQTIEILNTDAEGRLILCDALTYAERFKPAAIIDVATLTGACVIALGNVASGLFSNDEKLAQNLLNAGEKVGDRAWQMPIWEEYQPLLKSPFADMANVGGREAGSISAACFLARFAKKQKWAHLDIAGTAWKSGSEKCATGRPVSLLTQFLMDQQK